MTKYKPNEVAVLSTVFSAISIVIAALTIITKELILKKQCLVVIKFEVSSQELVDGMERKMKGIIARLSPIL